MTEKVYVIIDGLNGREDHCRFIHDPEYNSTMNLYMNFPALIKWTYNYCSEHPFSRISLEFQTDDRVPEVDRLTNKQKRTLVSIAREHNDSVGFIDKVLKSNA